MTLDTTKLSRVKKGCNVAWITIIACLLVPWAALFAFHIVKNHSDLCKNSVCFSNVWSGVQATKGCLACSHCDVAWITIIACYSNSTLWKIIQICAKTLFVSLMFNLGFRQQRAVLHVQMETWLEQQLLLACWWCHEQLCVCAPCLFKTSTFTDQIQIKFKWEMRKVFSNLVEMNHQSNSRVNKN